MDFVDISMDFSHKTLLLLALGKEDVCFCPSQDVILVEKYPFKVKRGKAKLSLPFARGFESKLNHHLLCLLFKIESPFALPFIRLKPCPSISPEA